MTEDPKRKFRLATAQGELAKLLEMKIRLEERNISLLQEDATALSGALEKEGTAGLVTRSAALRRVTALERLKRSSEQSVASLRQQLLSARGRRDSLERQAEAHHLERRRRVEAAEGLEAALNMRSKGSGKTDVVK